MWARTILVAGLGLALAAEAAGTIGIYGLGAAGACETLENL